MNGIRGNKMLLRKFKRTKKSCLSGVIALALFAGTLMQPTQVNAQTTKDHDKQVIGYFTQWDAWKAEQAGVPVQGALTHLNVDMDKYTILNYSFFGVANDGSLHSGDFRDKRIHEAGVSQAPAPLLYTDIYSSWDLFILYGELDGVHYISEDIAEKARAQGFDVTVGQATWSNPTWGVYNQPLPLPLKKEGGAPGVFDMAKEKGVKVMASIGGWSMCKHFPEVANDPAKRKVFVDECVRLIDMGFDGIDLDWEYPGPYEGMNFKGLDVDYDNFITLTKEIREAIGDDKLITSCFSADTKKLDNFDWNEVDKYVDYYNFMSYDFNGGWSDIAGHNSPLYGYTDSEAPNFNWDFLYNYLVEENVNLDKVNMGMAFYGRGAVTDGSADLNAPTVKRNENIQPDGNVITCADYTNWPAYDGTPNYYHIVDKALSPNSGWTRHWDDEAKVPYLTKDNFFLSYDDEESIGYKAQYINDRNLAGTIIWTAYGDLDLQGSYTSYGTKLKKWDNVKSPLVDKVNEVFAAGFTPDPNQNRDPVITGVSNKTINVGDKFDPLAGVKATDPEDGDLTDKIVVTGAVDTNKAGTYKLTYKVTDSDGASATATATITVVKKGEEPVDPDPVDPEVPSDSDWQSGKIYLAGDTVTWKGSKWKAGWWTQGQEPGTTGEWGVWTKVGGADPVDPDPVDPDPVDPDPVDPEIPSDSDWQSGTVYVGGDTVTWKGSKWKAKWWTQGDEPGTGGEWGVWTKQ